MNEKLRNHPLNGIGLDALLGDLVREYGWDILAEQLPISCFKNYPSFDSSIKFLRKTEWARERLEDLYLYKYLQYPLPQGVERKSAPRNRIIDDERLATTPFKISLGDPEFFADPKSPKSRFKPQSGSRRKPAAGSRKPTQAKPDSYRKRADQADRKPAADSNAEVGADPWAKWRKD